MNILENLVNIVNQQQILINQLAERLDAFEPGGSASIEDYIPNTAYKRNMLLVDTASETVYRVINDYTASSVTTDCQNGKLKLVGFESQVVSFNHNPTQSEIETLPEGSIVAVYSSTDTPYVPDLQ